MADYDYDLLGEDEMDEMFADEEELLGALEDEEEIYLLGEDDDELGASWPFFRRGRMKRRFPRPVARARARATRRGRAGGLIRRPSTRSLQLKAYTKALTSRAPGVPKRTPTQFPLGFETVVFDNTSALVLLSQSWPQLPFKGGRLVCVVTRTAAALEAITITNFMMGQYPQMVSAQPLPVEAFANDATDIALVLDSIQPGVIGTIQFACAANPGVGESITIQPMIVGASIG